MDWKKTKVEDFSIEIQGEEIRQSGDRMVFPVGVYHKDNELVLQKAVPLPAEFYKQLRNLDGWKEKLMVILRNRVRDDIQKRINAGDVAIDDKVDLILTEREKL